MFLAKKWGCRCDQVWFFGSNGPLAVLIDPWTHHVDVLKGKKGVLRKTEALLGKIRPKLAQICYTRNANFGRTHLQTCLRADFFTILSESKFDRGLGALEIDYWVN